MLRMNILISVFNLNIDYNSMRHVIVYSVLGSLLIVSIIFDMIFNPFKKSKMSILEKTKFKNERVLGKNIILFLTTLTKSVSLCFMLYEIITEDSSLKHLIPFSASLIALIIQLMFTYITRLLVRYYEILLIGIDKDLKNSGLIDILLDKDVIEQRANLSSGIAQKSENKINNEIEKQINVNKDVKNKNKKEQLYNAALYCLKNSISKDAIRNEFGLSPKRINGVFSELVSLGVFEYNNKTKEYKIVINDDKEIKKKIYS